MQQNSNDPIVYESRNIGTIGLTPAGMHWQLQRRDQGRLSAVVIEVITGISWGILWLWLVTLSEIMRSKATD